MKCVVISRDSLTEKARRGLEALGFRRIKVVNPDELKPQSQKSKPEAA